MKAAAGRADRAISGGSDHPPHPVEQAEKPACENPIKYNRPGDGEDLASDTKDLAFFFVFSVILTGTGIYPKLAKWGGAGALVPITGFANSVAAPAIEYKKEGDRKSVV